MARLPRAASPHPPGGRPDARLSRAYGEAVYQIDAHPPINLVPGHISPALRRLHERWPCQQSAFITACNPRSRRLRPAANQRRLRALKKILAHQGLVWLDGVARDPLGLWPDEPSVWLPGLSADASRALARRFGQHALLWNDAAAKSHLLWVAY